MPVTGETNQTYPNQYKSFYVRCLASAPDNQHKSFYVWCLASARASPADDRKVNTGNPPQREYDSAERIDTVDRQAAGREGEGRYASNTLTRAFQEWVVGRISSNGPVRTGKLQLGQQLPHVLDRPERIVQRDRESRRAHPVEDSCNTTGFASNRGSIRCVESEENRRSFGQGGGQAKNSNNQEPAHISDASSDHYFNFRYANK